MKRQGNDRLAWNQYMREWRLKNPDKYKVNLAKARAKFASGERVRKPRVHSGYESAEAKAAVNAGYYSKNRDRIRALQGGRIHGISAEEYTERRSQPCAICGVLKVEPGKRGSGMHIDHDHRTGKIRGTLCDRCNRGIGMFDDSVEKLQAAIQYLCTP